MSKRLGKHRRVVRCARVIDFFLTLKENQFLMHEGGGFGIAYVFAISLD